MSNPLSLSAPPASSSTIQNQNPVMLEPCKHILPEGLIWNACDFQLSSKLCPTCLQHVTRCVPLETGSKQVQEVASQVQESTTVVLPKKLRPEPAFPGISALFICTHPWGEVNPKGGSLCRLMALQSRTPDSFLDSIDVCGYLNGGVIISMSCKGHFENIFRSYVYDSGFTPEHSCIFYAKGSDGQLLRRKQAQLKWVLHVLKTYNRVPSPELQFIESLVEREKWTSAECETKP